MTSSVRSTMKTRQILCSKLCKCCNIIQLDKIKLWTAEPRITFCRAELQQQVIGYNAKVDNIVRGY